MCFRFCCPSLYTCLYDEIWGNLKILPPSSQSPPPWMFKHLPFWFYAFKCFYSFLNIYFIIFLYVHIYVYVGVCVSVQSRDMLNGKNSVNLWYAFQLCNYCRWPKSHFNSLVSIFWSILGELTSSDPDFLICKMETRALTLCLSHRSYSINEWNEWIKY